MVLATVALLPLTLTPAVSADQPAVDIAGLERPGMVVRDALGVPHVVARTRHDLYFLQGWAHANDRLFQMDVSRREASGTLAELLGPSALSSDVQLRTIGVRRAAEHSLAVLSQPVRRHLQAYADGVNAWMRDHPLPREYQSLNLTGIPPWSPLDSVTILKAALFQLSFEIDLENTTRLRGWVQAGQARGFDGSKLYFEDMARAQPFTPAATVPDATGTAAAAAGGAEVGNAAHLTDAARLAGSYLAVAGTVPIMRRFLDGGADGTGSNEWAVSGRRTVDGKALIANDPHLPLGWPSVFYPIHLRLLGGPTDVTGSGFPGVPAVLIGRNRHISWGATTNPVDVTDTYLEQVRSMPGSPSGLATVFQGRLEPIQVVPETFRTNNPGSGRPDNVTVVPRGGGVPAATLIVPRRNNGPIIQLDRTGGVALSVQYTGYSGTRELETFFRWDDATDLREFRAGLATFDVGSQNWMYGDVRGNIAYFTSAEVPLREDLQAGGVSGVPPMFVRDGTGGNEWLPVRDPLPGQAVPYEILPPGEMPQVVNPANGFFVSANNDPAGHTLDNDLLNQTRPGGGIYYLGGERFDQFRGGRITDLLAERFATGRVSAADMRAVQNDVGLVDAEFFVPHLVWAMTNAKVSDHPALRELAGQPRVAEAAQRLAGWDFTTPTGIAQGYDATDIAGIRLPPSDAEVDASVAATIYAVWRSRFLRDAVDTRFASLGVPAPLPVRALTGLKHLLDTFPSGHGVGASGIDFFATLESGTPEQRRDLVLLRALSGALSELSSEAFAPAFHGSTTLADYRWGRLHHVVLRHRLDGEFSAPPAFGKLPRPVDDLAGIPTDGGFGTVDVAPHNLRGATAGDFAFTVGPAQRYLSASGQGTMKSWISLPGGLSGLPDSPFYTKHLLPFYLTNESVPLLLRRPH